MSKIFSLLTLCIALLAGHSLPAFAQASSLLGNYYILALNHEDTGIGIDGAVVPGLVGSALSANGLPVVTNLAKTRTTGSGSIKDYNANNELLWWTPQTASISTVTYEKTQTDSVATLSSSYASNFYPDGHSNNSNGYRAVHWAGTFNMSAVGNVTFTLGSDDDAWLFLDGKLVVDDGGVHANQSAANTLSNITIGSHSLDLFFADRHVSGSGITFNSSVALTPGVATPEPGSIALLAGMGLTGGVFLHRKRTRK